MTDKPKFIYFPNIDNSTYNAYCIVLEKCSYWSFGHVFMACGMC